MKSAVITASVLGTCLFLFVSIPSPAHELVADEQADIAGLIEQLGSESFPEREAAERQLIEIGAPAILALRKAREHPDPEIRFRARRAYQQLAELSPQRREELRKDAQQAFQQGDYETTVLHYGLLAARENPTFDDCLWLGHAYQLTESWTKALAAYQRALDVLKAQRKGLIQERSALLLLTGRLQREELKDLQAAATTLAKASDYSATMKRPLEELSGYSISRLERLLEAGSLRPDFDLTSELRYPVRALKELAFVQEEMGQIDRAIESLTRAHQAWLLSGNDPGNLGIGDLSTIEHIGRLLQKLPPEAPLPLTPNLIFLSPENPVVTLRLDEARSLARAYRQSSMGSPFWRFALSPPPGQEFATLECACDIEQIEPRRGGHFGCWAMAKGKYPGRVEIGYISWPREEAAGRKVVSSKFRVPEGAGLVHITTGHSKDHFKVHSVSIEATFRPRQEPGPGLIPPVWFQTEALPPGGKLTRNGKTITSEVAYSGVAPGDYVFGYALPGHQKKWRCEAKLVPGGSYGIFVNLDSPFRWKLTNLRRVNRCSLVRMGDGRWLLAYSTWGSKVMLSTSKDLVTWGRPATLSQNSAFHGKAPALLADDEGMVWLAYLSDRVYLKGVSRISYRLWLTHSRDGRTWSRPVLIRVGQDRGGRTPYMLKDADDRYRIFAGGFAGSGDLLGEIRALQPIPIGPTDRENMINPHVVVDARGGLHIVFSDHTGEILYLNPAEGKAWTQPVSLRKPQDGRASNPQLIINGGRLALIYETNAGAYLRRGKLQELPKLGPPMKITNHVVPLKGSRVHITNDGKVVLLAGTDTVWLLEADLEEVLGSGEEDE